MLVGFPPFEGNDPLDLYKTIVANQPKYPKKIGPQSQEIISAFLTTSPADRLGSSKAGAEDVKKTAFFKKIVAWCRPITPAAPRPACGDAPRPPHCYCPSLGAAAPRCPPSPPA